MLDLTNGKGAFIAVVLGSFLIVGYIPSERQFGAGKNMDEFNLPFQRSGDNDIKTTHLPICSKLQFLFGS